MNIKKYPPEHVIIKFDKRFVSSRVIQVVAHPPRQHPKGSCIRNELYCVELKTECGSRWYGFNNAYIDSHLRMVCVLMPGQEKDEVVMKWENVY